MPIEVTDCVLVRGKAKSLKGANINKDEVVDLADFAALAGNCLQSSIVEVVGCATCLHTPNHFVAESILHFTFA